MALPRTLQEWLTYLEERSQVIKLGLERVQCVAKRGNLLSLDCPVITVAGTNGKGSTVKALASMFHRANVQVGAYYSPHLLEFNERIQFNNVHIQDQEICDAFCHIYTLQEDTFLSYFEFITLAALYIFKQRKPDIVLLEVGLGGRFDAVNIISPTLAIITALGLDHQAYLGESLEEIGYQKAGILRSGIPLVLSHQARVDSILKEADLHRNELYIEGRDFGFDKNNMTWQFAGDTHNISTKLCPESVSLALAAYKVMTKNWRGAASLKNVCGALETAYLPGRFQECEINGIHVIVDVAHNPLASQWLAKKLAACEMPGRWLAVWSGLADKSLVQTIAALRTQISAWYVGALQGVSRAASNRQLAEVLETADFDSVKVANTVSEAFTECLNEATEADGILVFGSFHTIEQVIKTCDSEQVEYAYA